MPCGSKLVITWHIMGLTNGAGVVAPGIADRHDPVIQFSRSRRVSLRTSERATIETAIRFCATVRPSHAAARTSLACTNNFCEQVKQKDGTVTSPNSRLQTSDLRPPRCGLLCCGRRVQTSGVRWHEIPGVRLLDASYWWIPDGPIST